MDKKNIELISSFIAIIIVLGILVILLPGCWALAKDLANALDNVFIILEKAAN